MKRVAVALTAFGVALVAVPKAQAQANVTSGNISLGVCAGGALDCLGLGIQNNVTGHDGVIAGCTCEGWGVGVSGGTFDGKWNGQNTSAGPGDPSVASSGSTAGTVAFTSTPTTATSTVTMAGMMSITQFYHPSASADLYQVDVTITNLSTGMLGSGASGIRYRREMDWDIPPTVFDEYATIHGWGATNLLSVADNGFVTSNPFIPLVSVGTQFAGTCPLYPINSDLYHAGPCDHGAAFDFGFAALDVGASRTFTIFYGAAKNEATALADLGAVSADDVYSLAQSDCAHVGIGGGDAACVSNSETFIFGFKGVGGTTVTGTPEPASIALMGTGLLGLAGVARRRRRA